MLRHNTYIIVSYKNMKKTKNGTWLSWQSGKTPKKREKLRLCWPKYLKEGRWPKIKFFECHGAVSGADCPEDMWKSIMVALNWAEGFFERFPCFIKNSRVNLKLIDLITIKSSWKFHWKSLNDFSDILTGVSKNSVSRKTKVKWKTP